MTSNIGKNVEQLQPSYTVGGNMKWYQPFWEKVWKFLINLTDIYSLSHFSWYLPKRNENTSTTRAISKNIHGSFILNSPKLEISQVSMHLINFDIFIWQKKKKTEFFIKHNLKSLTKNIYCTILFIWYLQQIRFMYGDKRSEEQLLLEAGGRNWLRRHMRKISGGPVMFHSLVEASVVFICQNSLNRTISICVFLCT